MPGPHDIVLRGVVAQRAGLRGPGAGLRVRAWRPDMDGPTRMVVRIFAVMAARARTESGFNGVRSTGSGAKCRAVGKDLDGRRQSFTDPQICNVARLIGAEGAAHPGRRGPRQVVDHPASPGPRVAHADDLDERASVASLVLAFRSWVTACGLCWGAKTRSGPPLCRCRQGSSHALAAGRTPRVP